MNRMGKDMDNLVRPAALRENVWPLASARLTLASLPPSQDNMLPDGMRMVIVTLSQIAGSIILIAVVQPVRTLLAASAFAPRR